MSLSLNINNFCEDAVPSILSKNFLDDSNFNVESTNSSIVPNKVQGGTGNFHQNAFLDANLNLNDNISFFDEDILSNLNYNNENKDKDQKVGTLNVYNKCVFLLNNKTNEEHNTNNNNNDNNTATFSKQTNYDPHFPKSNIVENNVFNNHQDNYLNSTNSTDSVSSNLKSTRRARHKQSTKPNQQQHQHITEKQHKLFFCHNNDLKPILSPMIKSGVYRKIYGPGEKKIDMNLENQKFNNVCLSTNDVCGKVITLEEFQKNYVEETDFDEIISYSSPNSSVLPPVSLEKSSFNPTVTNTASCVPTTTHSPNELNTFARNILNFKNGELENFIVNKEQNKISYKNSSNKKHFNYRLMFPEEFGDLRNSNGCTNNSLLPPSTPFIKDCPLPFSQESNKTDPLSFPTCPLKKSISRRGRPRKVPINQTPSPKGLSIQQEQNSSVVMVKTRYGRLSKLPTHIQEDFKVSMNNNNETSNEKISIAEIRDEIKDKDYKFVDTEKDERNTLIQDCNPKVRRERNIPSEYQCKVCNKIFLGKRIQHHYKAYPDHNITKTRELYQKFLTETTLYKFLVEKIKQSSCIASENRTDIFLNEISDLVEQLQSRSSRLVQNTSGMHFVNSRISKVLGIPEGHYCINADEIDAPPDPQSAVENENSNLIDVQSTGPPRLDYNLSISLDDTIADAKLNMITSDDSLLRTVNDLMEEGIKNLTGGNHVMDNAVHHNPHHHHHHHHQTTASSVMHYDHASDNAVEAVSIKETQQPALLDLSLDLFQFNSN